MQIITVWPPKSIKLYHRKAGDVIQICNNDGSVDSNLYMVVDRKTGSKTEIVNLANGKLNNESVSCRTITFRNAALVPNYNEDEE